MFTVLSAFLVLILISTKNAQCDLDVGFITQYPATFFGRVCGHHNVGVKQHTATLAAVVK
jgi:hypothetical protein